MTKYSQRKIFSLILAVALLIPFSGVLASEVPSRTAVRNSFLMEKYGATEFVANGTAERSIENTPVYKIGSSIVSFKVWKGLEEEIDARYEAAVKQYVSSAQDAEKRLEDAKAEWRDAEKEIEVLKKEKEDAEALAVKRASEIYDLESQIEFLKNQKVSAPAVAPAPSPSVSGGVSPVRTEVKTETPEEDGAPLLVTETEIAPVGITIQEPAKAEGFFSTIVHWLASLF